MNRAPVSKEIPTSRSFQAILKELGKDVQIRFS